MQDLERRCGHQGLFIEEKDRRTKSCHVLLQIMQYTSVMPPESHEIAINGDQPQMHEACMITNPHAIDT